MKILPLLKLTRRKLIIVAVILTVLAGILFIVSRGNQMATIQTVKVERKDIKVQVSGAGKLTSKEVVDLRFKTGGKLNFLGVTTGDMVSEGQVLARLDTQDLGIKLSQAENSLDNAQANVDKILDDIHLFQYGNGGFANIGTANETQTQRQLRIQAQAQRDNAYDSVKLAQRDFQDAIISSPINGLAVQVDFLPGQFVSSADLIVKVADNTKPIFEAEVDEADITKISAGQDVEITLDAYPNQVFKGRVEQVMPQTKTTSTGGNIIIVKISLLDPGIKFITGLNGQALITIAEKKGELIIPQEALKDDNSVVVQTRQGLRAQKVEVGLRSDTDIEVKKGLMEGDVVIKNPPQNLSQNRNFNPLIRIFRR